MQKFEDSLNAGVLAREVVYESRPILRRPLVLFQEMVRDLLASRHLAHRLLVRNLAAQFRQSLLGYLWLFLAPLLATAGLMFLSSQKILPSMGNGVFVFTGIVLWQCFTDACQRPMQWVSMFRSVMGRVKFPHEAILLGAVAEVLIYSGIRLVLLVLVLVASGQLGVHFYLAPLALLALIALGVMFGVFLAPAGLVVGDIERGFGLIMLFWFSLTPVVYPPLTVWPGSLLTYLNPVSPLLITTREFLMGDSLTLLQQFSIVTGAVGALSILGWLLFRVAMPHLIERVS